MIVFISPSHRHVLGNVKNLQTGCNLHVSEDMGTAWDLAPTIAQSVPVRWDSSAGLRHQWQFLSAKHTVGAEF